jgi:hypothetical protein
MDKKKSEASQAKECGNCLYFRFRADAPGSCRRYPPRVIPVGGDCLTCWPHVRESDTCGEFRSKQRERKKPAAPASRELALAGVCEPAAAP